ncbi:MAG TPA: glycosyltransferase family 2 protein [Vicinamibacterales bacterium]|nr:glycosyltransferase family 2 protein [Vicinamibacterales bacterium]
MSVAVPLHNEETVLPELMRRVGSVLQSLPGGPHEVVFVDDGSTDRTLEVLRDIAVRDARVVAVVLSRNFGHQAALTAALDHVTGDVTVVMDGDLQDQPEAIPQFLELFQSGYDVVYAKRVRRKEPWWLRFSYYVFYRLLARLSDTQLPTDAGDFGLLSRRVVDELRRLPEHHRYLRGLRSWVGFKQVGIEVERSARHSGRSKYNLSRLLKLAADAVFAFSIVPLRLAAIVGLMAVVCSVLFAMYSVIAKVFLDQSPVGFTALIWIITFLSGTILVFLGVIGEYVGRVYEELKARPVYIVSRVLRADSAGMAESPLRFAERERAI